MRRFRTTFFFIAMAFALGGCNAGVLVKPTDTPPADTEFAFVLIGVRYDKDDSILTGWNMIWLRRGPDVEWNDWSGYDPSDRVWLSNFNIMSVEPDNGVQYFLRKVRPGHYAFESSMRLTGQRITLSPGDKLLLEFDAARGKVTYAGTLTLGLHPQYTALIPVSLEDDSSTAFQHVASNFAISLPTETSLMSFTDMSVLGISKRK